MEGSISGGLGSREMEINCESPTDWQRMTMFVALMKGYVWQRDGNSTIKEIFLIF